MRTLALDVGGKRTGFALSDQGGRLVSPYDQIEASDEAQVIDAAVAICDREGVQRLVVGCPLNMDGTAGKPAQAMLRLARHLTARTGLPTVLVDERRSSVEADEQLSARRRAGERLTHGGKKRRRDALAAATFLQAFLDGDRAGVDAAEPEALQRLSSAAD